ncbi:MAG: low specificity L-threonine aldolase [Pseudomonadota bacterium]
MLFGSDNWAGAAPQIVDSLAKHAQGHAVAYGDGDLDAQVEATFKEVFETDCHVFFVGTGTAANNLAFASTMKPGGVGFCHSEAHITANEGGGPEAASGGGRLCTVEGDQGKMSASALRNAVADYPQEFNHFGRGTMVSITQTTEAGTYYSLEEIAAIGNIAKDNDLATHMDGARFANALVALGCSPADMTWRNGVDMVSFGGTKNGCWCAEALVVFDDALARDIEYVRKRMGHLFSKTRFITAQFEAYFNDGLWLELARHSNAIGLELVDMLSNSPNAKLAWPSETNQVFFIVDSEKAKKWINAGARIHPFPTPKAMAGSIGENEKVYRAVASFISTADEVAQLGDIINS